MAEGVTKSTPKALETFSLTLYLPKRPSEKSGILEAAIPLLPNNSIQPYTIRSAPPPLTSYTDKEVQGSSERQAMLARTDTTT